MNNFKWSAPPQVGDEVIPHDFGQYLNGEMRRMIGKPHKITYIGHETYYLGNEWNWYASELTPANWHFCNDGSARAMRCVKALDTDHLGHLKYYGMSGTCNTTAHYDEPVNSYLCDLSQAEALLGLEEWKADEIKSGDLVEGSDNWVDWHDGYLFGYKKHNIDNVCPFVCEDKEGCTVSWKHIRPAQPKPTTMEDEISALVGTYKSERVMQIIKRHTK